MPGAVAALVAALDDDPPLGGGRAARLRTGDGTCYPSARRFPSLVDAAGHAVSDCGDPRTASPGATSGTTSTPPGRSPVDWVSGAVLPGPPLGLRGGGRLRRGLLHVRRGRRPVLAAATVPGGESATCRRPRSTHLQGVSTPADPYRMLVAHHRSLLRSPAVGAPGPGRLAPAPGRRRSSGRRRRAPGRPAPWRRPGRPPASEPGSATRHGAGRSDAVRSAYRQAVGFRPIMADESTGKWVRRAASTGGGRTYRGQTPVNWYLSLLLIVLIGVSPGRLQPLREPHPQRRRRAARRRLPTLVRGRWRRHLRHVAADLATTPNTSRRRPGSTPTATA